MLRRRFLALALLFTIFLGRASGAQAAIAFDAVTEGGFAVTTFSHTCATGAILFLYTFERVGTAQITGATYGGNAMTQIGTGADDGAAADLIRVWYLVNPPSGANNVVLSGTLVALYEGFAISYTGSLQSSVPNASQFQSNEGPTTLVTRTVTTTTNNSWSILAVVNNTGATTASTGSTLRLHSAARVDLYDSNGPITPAGSHSMSATGASSQFGSIMLAFAPATSVKGMLLVFGR